MISDDVLEKDEGIAPMNWISVQDDLPKDGELVLVLAWTYSPRSSPLCQRVEPCIFEGSFHRCQGWFLSFHPEVGTNVRYWQKRPENPEHLDMVE